MPPSQIITEKDVEHVARLARIHLNEDEIPEFTTNLASILEYVAQLKSLDTDNIKPTTHPLPITNVYRTDEATHSLSQKEALSIAVEQKDDFFKVPKVIE